ncbi:MAG: hypothetical protein JWO23_45 [Solirubrobacterales bacterium]|jgi:hypothetical protein|nr:hypothetical protein [Solirubrobacterales bacterium]MCW3026504.1 hypothetical protein [Solirubrobacterales bacterium]
MGSTAIFPTAPLRSGMYESFYLRAVSPTDPVGVWIRHTIHKRPGRQPTGSVWCTVFDARLRAPFMHKLTSPAPLSPPDGWIEVAGSRIRPGRAEGGCGPARWSLRFASREPELRHLAPRWLYRAPLPRTKLTSPAPAASFDGVLEIDGRAPIELRGWPGMVGHNWGSEHAERWIWLHGIAFDGAPGTWIDVALGRLKVAGRLTPWVANGALSLEGSRHRIGGLRAHGLRVQESARGCVLRVPGRDLELEARVEVPDGSAAGWRYADPDGGEHDVVNCSVASIELLVKGPGAHDRTLSAAHGGAYELGMRTPRGTGEREHGVPIAPFADG